MITQSTPEHTAPIVAYITRDDSGVEHYHYPVLHMLPSGNYLSCNQYWAIGLQCPHGEENA